MKTSKEFDQRWEAVVDRIISGHRDQQRLVVTKEKPKSKQPFNLHSTEQDQIQDQFTKCRSVAEECSFTDIQLQKLSYANAVVRRAVAIRNYIRESGDISANIIRELRDNVGRVGSQLVSDPVPLKLCDATPKNVHSGVEVSNQDDTINTCNELWNRTNDNLKYNSSSFNQVQDAQGVSTISKTPDQSKKRPRCILAQSTPTPCIPKRGREYTAFVERKQQNTTCSSKQKSSISHHLNDIPASPVEPKHLCDECNTHSSEIHNESGTHSIDLLNLSSFETSPSSIRRELQQTEIKETSDFDNEHTKVPHSPDILQMLSFSGVKSAPPLETADGNDQRCNASHHKSNSLQNIPDHNSEGESSFFNATSFSWDEHSFSSPLFSKSEPTSRHRVSPLTNKNKGNGRRKQNLRREIQQQQYRHGYSKGLQLRHVGDRIIQPEVRMVRVILKIHQREAITWMRQRECSLNLALTSTDKKERKEGLTNALQIDVEAVQPSCTLGGLLADDTGMGKTLTMLAHVAEEVESCRRRSFKIKQQWSQICPKKETSSNLAKDLSRMTLHDSPTSSTGNRQVTTIRHGDVGISMNSPQPCQSVTLVVVPLAVLSHWHSEIRAHTGLSVYIHHGAQRLQPSTLRNRLRCIDIVLTTYSLLSKQECADVPDDEMFDCTCCCRKNLHLMEQVTPTKSNNNRMPHNYKSSKPVKRVGWTHVDGKQDSSCLYSCLHRVVWERIILDEAHLIVNEKTRRARAAFSLRSRGGRWCITATPMQNHGIKDLTSILRFIGVPHVESLVNKSKDQTAKNIKFTLSKYMLRRLKGKITRPLSPSQVGSPKIQLDQSGILPSDKMKGTHGVYRNENSQNDENSPLPVSSGSISNNEKVEICDRVREAIVIPTIEERYNSNSMIDNCDLPKDRELVDFPTMNDITKHVNFRTDFEKEFYEALVKCTRTNLVAALAAQHAVHLSGNSKKNGRESAWPLADVAPGVRPMHVFDWLTKCRQFCCHPQLVLQSMSIEDEDSRHSSQATTALDEDNDKKNNDPQLVLAAKYKECFTDEQWALFLEMCGVDGVVRDDSRFVSSKISMLLEDLKEKYRPQATGKAKPYGKFVVLTAWTGFMRILAAHLVRDGFKVAQMHGGLSASQRNKILESFASDHRDTRHPEGLVATIGTLGVGLNLRNVSALYLMEPSWNPATETQAIGRISRLGMKHAVQVTRYILQNTVEDRMRAVQATKQATAVNVFAMCDSECSPSKQKQWNPPKRVDESDKRRKSNKNEKRTKAQLGAFCNLLDVDESEETQRLAKRFEKHFLKPRRHKVGLSHSLKHLNFKVKRGAEGNNRKRNV